MAKRKRLSARVLSEPLSEETGAEPARGARAPIAQVAADASAQSALNDLADEMRDIKESGRLVVLLPLSEISEDHMVRDRMVNDDEEMASLKASLLARGQQMPIEVIELAGGGYGLISGWRRLYALKSLKAETGDRRFDKIQALIKPLESVSDGYIAMVEENEVRVNLSFYERAHLACEAMRLGVYPTTARAISVLFSSAPAAKRSKIGSFVKLHGLLGAVLRFPSAIPERLGLALVSAAEADRRIVKHLSDVLSKTPPETAEAERAILEKALRKASGRKEAVSREVAPGIVLEARKGRLVLSGAGVTPDLQEDLKNWLAQRA